MEEERLDVLNTLAACIAVTDVTYGHVSGQNRHPLLIEDFCHQAVSLDPMEHSFRVDRYDSAALLPPMLQSMKTIVCKISRILHTINTKHTTFVMRLVIPVCLATLTHFV